MKQNNIFFILTIALFACLVLVNLSSAQGMNKVHIPQNTEEIEEMGKEALETGKRDLPGIIKKIWQEEAVPIWKAMYQWFRVNIWQAFFEKEVEPRIREEVRKREPIFEEELLVEKEELKNEVPGLWERLKRLWFSD